MTSSQPAPSNRVPSGVPTGGQFAASARTEADIALGAGTDPEGDILDMPTGSAWHTDEPIETLSLNAENRLATELARIAKQGKLTLDAPYQRGSVWDQDQRIGLVRSMLQRVPIPAVIMNDRMGSEWTSRYGFPDEGEPLFAAIDGKQRIETAIAWYDGDLPVPASWFEATDVDTPRHAADGTAWVTYDDLTERGRRRTENRFHLPVAVAHVGSVEEEAGIYLLVNGAGTAQSDDDMDNAARVAAGTANHDGTDHQEASR